VPIAVSIPLDTAREISSPNLEIAIGADLNPFAKLLAHLSEVRLNLSNLRLILIIALSIKGVMVVASPTGRAQIVELIGSPSWASQAQEDIAGYNTGAEDAAGWGDKNGTGFDDATAWDEADPDD
jgi:hypothetical protein